MQQRLVDSKAVTALNDLFSETPSPIPYQAPDTRLLDALTLTQVSSYVQTLYALPEPVSLSHSDQPSERAMRALRREQAPSLSSNTSSFGTSSELGTLNKEQLAVLNYIKQQKAARKQVLVMIQGPPGKFVHCCFIETVNKLIYGICRNWQVVSNK